MSELNPAEFPATGTTWLSTYEILEPLADAGSGQAWKARVAGSQKLVQIRLAKSLDTRRAEAWELLCKLSLSAPIIRPHARHEAAGRFFEVYDLPKDALTLPEWRRQQGMLGEAELRRCIKAIHEGLSALHRAGLAHLSLRQEALYVENDQGQLRILLGGLDLVTLRNQKDLVQVPVDPFHAPPEVAGLYKHAPGDRLLTWDSFAFGRIVQTLFLGRHVLGEVLNRDVSTSTPEIRERAEQLAFEKLDGHLRAGALEAMKQVPDRLLLLLRGLLAGSWEARWRDEEVDLWLEGGTPREHYNLPTKARCYRHAGQSCTIAEAAEQLRSAEHWNEAMATVFDNETPGTLGTFIKEEGDNEALSKMALLDSLRTEPWMQQHPEEAQRDMLTAIALQQLSGGKLTWRGRRLDATILLEMLEREDGGNLWLSRARILCAPPVLGLLDMTDAEAGRVLGEVGRHAKKAEDKARKQRWLQANDILGSAALWRQACQLNGLGAVIAALRAGYACSTDADVQTLFTQEKPGIDDQLILCHMASKPPAFGFLTHQEAAARRYAELFRDGQHASEMLFWKRLRRALSTGPWWFGKVWWLVAGWGLFALSFAVVKPGPGWLVVALVPLGLAFGLRAMLMANLQPILSIHFPQAKPWKLLDGPSRCDAARSELRSIGELTAIVRNINADIAKLTVLQPPPPKVLVPPTFLGLRATALCSWLLIAGLFGYVGWQAVENPPSLDALRIAWAGKPQDIEKLAAGEEDSEREETRIPWPHTRVPAEVRLLTPLESKPVSAKQQAAALRAGQALLGRYLPSTINVPVLVPVPVEKHFGYVLYDGRKKVLLSRNVIVLTFQPMPRTWIEVEGRKAYVHAE